LKHIKERKYRKINKNTQAMKDGGDLRTGQIEEYK
jgi:hypothetical protein